MEPAVVIATGQSLLPDPLAVVERVRHLPCVVVNDAYKIAPWAAALVACDPKWWEVNPSASQFAGEKWCAGMNRQGIARIPCDSGISTNSNSGLLGLDYWIRRGKKRVLLLGIDMHGTHYFGPHRNRPNTVPSRFAFFIEQFRNYAWHYLRGATVINCSPDSALDVFPRMTLEAALVDAEQRAA